MLAVVATIFAGVGFFSSRQVLQGVDNGEVNATSNESANDQQAPSAETSTATAESDPSAVPAEPTEEDEQLAATLPTLKIGVLLPANGPREFDREVFSAMAAAAALAGADITAAQRPDDLPVEFMVASEGGYLDEPDEGSPPKRSQRPDDLSMPMSTSS